ncbi:DUF5677 domain-containing protein [Microtetraspora malaysiensis]|uniref:DUF5677 domain-containing protein n=1 Tax=Microtetraspora malaysiensis TaxID=161358 RepID=UPI003D8BDA6B
MTYTFGNNAATLERARRLGKLLVDHADAIGEDGEIKVTMDNGEIFATLYGWWRLVNRSARALWLLADSGYTVESIPIMRNLFEHTIKLMWLKDNGRPGLNALAAYAEIKRSKQLEKLRTTGWSIADEIDTTTWQSAQVPAEGTPERARHNTLLGELKNVNNFLVAYDRADFYPVYSYLSEHSHPSIHTANAYIQDLAGGHFQLRHTAERAGYSDLLWATVCLIQAADMVSSVIVGDPLRRVVEEAAHDLGVGTPESLRGQRRTPFPAGS